jgi:phage terminase small subunit
MKRPTKAQVPDVATEEMEDDILTTALVTHNGQKLSPKEDRFISLYIKYADGPRAAKEAGYSIRAEVKNKDAQYAKKSKELLRKDYIKDEIAARSEEFRDKQIADTKEVLIYLSKVMRGEIKDQFNIDASLADRTAAAKELNRRLKELEDGSSSGSGKEIRLVLRRE